MGWTFYRAAYYKPNGQVDRKAECDELFEGEIIKSAMVGTTYYAAVRNKQGEVWAAVVLTKTNNRDYDNFGCKDMDETMGPCYYDCPVSILKALTPTDNETANEWRETCWQKHNAKRSPTALNNLPIGTKIRYNYGSEERIIVKCAPAYQFKTPWWYWPEKNCYIPKKRLPMEYEILEPVSPV